jgi:hypothetical protein
VKKNGTCNYCGKFRHYACECRKTKFDESKYRIKEGNFVDKEAEVSDDLENLKLFVSYVALSIETNDFNAWFIVSGVSIHMTCNRDWFKTYHEKTNGVKIYLGGDEFHKIKGYGDVSVSFSNVHVKQIKNAMYVPGTKKKPISVSKITDRGLNVEFVKSGCQVKDVQDHCKVGIGVGGLYRVDVTVESYPYLLPTTVST